MIQFLMALQLGISALIYAIVGYAVFTMGVKREKLDMNCPDGPDTKDMSVCKDGNGKLWSRHRYTEGDTVKSSLAKISALNHSYNKAIIWRRYLTLSFISTLLLFLVSLQRLPTGFELLGSMLIIFIVFYVAHNFYRYHHDRFIEEAITRHLRHLAQEIKK
jgi:hypothetical protein